ncbi:glycosyltransferase family 4 protein [Mucilaginibacter sp.]|uniref:glycosyltransferase family 4 protein n=1 Tax=Mucilaginibacter sp. TaxID=1882438 RepID=UPI0035BBDF95
MIGKKIMTIHDINQLHEDISTKQVNKYLKRLEKSIKTCDKLVTISHFAARDIVARFPSAAGKLSVIYNGADKLTVPTGHQPTYLPKSSFLFTIGILSAKKNFEVLPSLLAGNNYELIISGIKTSYEALIIKQAHKYGCENRVKITGTISDDDKAWYYKNCEAFVFPSLAEGFGLPIIEAMHFGKPVFCSTCTSLPEIAGDAAYYFDNFDSAAMQRVLREGLADFRENNREAMVMNHAAQYSWDQTAQQYLQLYQSCLT